MGKGYISFFSGYFIPNRFSLSYDLLVKIGLADKLEVETVNKDVYKYQGVGEIEYDGYKIVSYDDTVYETNMVNLVQTREFGIKKYLV